MPLILLLNIWRSYCDYKSFPITLNLALEVFPKTLFHNVVHPDPVKYRQVHLRSIE